jgi:hypothetical protein
MIGKKRQTGCLLFAFALLCPEAASSAGDTPSPELQASMMKMMVAETTGTPPSAKVRQWFRLIVMAPNPPGGPKLYFMKTPVRKPAFDGYTLDVQVSPIQYLALQRAAQSFGCDRKLFLPKPNAKPSEIPIIQLSVHDGGTTREVCSVSYGNACAYLNSVENMPGAGWSKSILGGLAVLRRATTSPYCQ